ncbi:MAG: GreA/GreB family elongation factor [Clostridia bacterium]|nr:GreA/GreB family elongation factor [Clostridia bacterium]
MISFVKKRSFYEVENQDAIIINFLFGYEIFVFNEKLLLNITEKQFNLVKNFLQEKQISYSVNYDDIHIEQKVYKNKNFETLLLKTQKELPSAYDLIEKLKSVKEILIEINNKIERYKEIEFYNNIQNLIDNQMKRNFDNIISDYISKNSTKMFCDSSPTPTYKKQVEFEEAGLKKIKIGSTILLQREDSEETQQYTLVENFDDVYDSKNYLSLNNTLAQILLNKAEWDFVEYNGKCYQIIQVINE